MFSRTLTRRSTAVCSDKIEGLKAALAGADAVVIGAGAGLSASAGLTYSGERFEKNFGDFMEKYGIRDLYSGGFYPFASLEEHWAWWSRHIMINRYERPPRPVYDKLLELVQNQDYFVLTTNVDHQFQLAGFDKRRLFYTQGDYGLWQCGQPCHRETYDNEDAVRRMAAEQRDMKIPAELIPRCPKCGRPMAMNLRCGSTFVEDAGWERAASRYGAFLLRHKTAGWCIWNWAWGPIRRPLSNIPSGNTPARIPRRSMPASIWGRRWRRRKSPGSPSASMPTSAVCLRCWHNSCAA